MQTGLWRMRPLTATLPLSLPKLDSRSTVGSEAPGACHGLISISWKIYLHGKDMVHNRSILPRLSNSELCPLSTLAAEGCRSFRCSTCHGCGILIVFFHLSGWILGWAGKAGDQVKNILPSPKSPPSARYLEHEAKSCSPWILKSCDQAFFLSKILTWKQIFNRFACLGRHALLVVFRCVERLERLCHCAAMAAGAWATWSVGEAIDGILLWDSIWKSEHDVKED